jgi:putative colanic acid biosynthesis UDP-glucose lipid carrier transferase
MQTLRRFYIYLKISTDLILLASSYVISSFLAKNRINPEILILDIKPEEIILFVVFYLIWYFSAKAIGLYDEFRSRTTSFELIAVFKCSSIQLISAVFILFMSNILMISRYFVIVYFLLQLVLVSLGKLGLRALMINMRKKGRNLRSMLIVGAGEVGRSFHKTILTYPQMGYYLIGFLDDQDQPELGSDYLGTIDNLEDVLQYGKVDEVVIALPNDALDRIDQVTTCCEKFPTNVRIIPDYFRLIAPRFNVSIVGDFPIISIRANPQDELHLRLLKRAFDLGVSILSFVFIFSWLWPVLAIIIKLSSPGPVFFKQERWGRKNRRIICYKFRSMVKDSRDIDENGKYLQATKNDSRVTPFGRFLRKTNIDEFPQFLNVLKGEMSIVGPRPHPTPLNIEAKENIRHYMLRHLVKPGISGWAQVNGYRGETSDSHLMQKRVEHDIWYIENWSFWFDIQIILMTIWKMFTGNPEAY